MDTIIKKKVNLIRWLSADSLILQHVHSRELVTMDEYGKLTDISDRADRITKLLDTILSKGDPLCLKFLDLLKENDVNESSPELREWILTVNTSEQSLAIGRSETDCIAGTQMNPGTQSQGDHVTINLRDDDASHTNSTAENQESVRKIQSALYNDVENIVRTISGLSLSDQMPVK